MISFLELLVYQNNTCWRSFYQNDKFRIISEMNFQHFISWIFCFVTTIRLMSKLINNDDNNNVHSIIQNCSKSFSFDFESKRNGYTLFEKSIFCPKIQFWQNPNIFTSFFTKFFWQFFSWNQSCQQLRSRKPQHFHEFFTRQFFRQINVEFLDIKWRFRTVWTSSNTLQWQIVNTSNDTFFVHFTRLRNWLES